MFDICVLSFITILRLNYLIRTSFLEQYNCLDLLCEQLCPITEKSAWGQSAWGQTFIVQ